MKNKKIPEMAAQIIKLLEDFQQKNTVLQQRAASLGGEKDNAEFRAKLFDMSMFSSFLHFSKLYDAKIICVF